MSKGKIMIACLWSLVLNKIVMQAVGSCLIVFSFVILRESILRTLRSVEAVDVCFLIVPF